MVRENWSQKNGETSAATFGAEQIHSLESLFARRAIVCKKMKQIKRRYIFFISPKFLTKKNATLYRAAKSVGDRNSLNKIATASQGTDTSKCHLSPQQI